MTLKSIISFLFFTLLSVYFSFLNPHEVKIHFAQNYSLSLPMVVLFLGSILLGILITGLLHGSLSIKRFFANIKLAGRNKLRKKTNRRIGILLEEAENLAAGGCVSKAIPVYEKILNLSPNHITVINRLGNMLREEGDPDRALELHLKAVQIASNNLDSLYGLADDYSVKARQSFSMHQKEMATLEKIEKIDRKSPRVFYRMREIYLKSKDWGLAADIQKKLIARIEEKSDKGKEKKMLSQYIYNNGVGHFNNNNFEVAIPEFKKTLREDPKCLSAHIILGDSYMKTNNRKAALKAWKTGYENTNSPVCLLRMENLYRELNQVEEMVAIYKEAIKKAENSTRKTLGMLLGSIFLEKGNPQATIQVIVENTDSQKTIIPSLILANAYRQQNDQNSSKKAMENASFQIKGAILNFKCDGCGKTLGEWIDTCPVCHAFDKIECRPGVNS